MALNVEEDSEIILNLMDGSGAAVGLERCGDDLSS